MTADRPVSRLEVERAELARQREQRHKSVLDRLRWAAPGGMPAAEIATRIGGTATAAGVGATLRELAAEGQVHDRAGVWYHGPDPAPLALLSSAASPGGRPIAEIVLEVVGSRVWFRAELASAVAARGLGRPQAMLAIDALVAQGELEHPHPADTRVQRPKVRTNVEAARLSAALAGAEPIRAGETASSPAAAHRDQETTGCAPDPSTAAPDSEPALEPDRATEDLAPAAPAEGEVATGDGDPIPPAPSGSPAEVAPALAGQLEAPPDGHSVRVGPTDAEPPPPPPAETDRGSTRSERGTLSLTGAQIRAAREERGWSQNELARQMAAHMPGTHATSLQSGLSTLERGHWSLADDVPRARVWSRVLAKVFGLEPASPLEAEVERPAVRSSSEASARAARLRATVLAYVTEHPGCLVSDVAAAVGRTPTHVRYVCEQVGIVSVQAPWKGDRTIAQLYPPGHTERPACRLCGKVVDGTEVCPACLADSDPLPTSASPEAPRVSTASPPAVSASADVHPQPSPAPAPSDAGLDALSCGEPTAAGVTSLTWWPTVMQHNCGRADCDAPATRTYDRGGWRAHRCDAHPLTDESSTSRPPAEEPGGRGAPPSAGGDVLEPSAPEVVEVAPARPAPAAAVLAADLSAQLAVEREDLADYRRAHAELEAEIERFDRWLDLLGVPRAPEGEGRGWRRGWAQARMGGAR